MIHIKANVYQIRHRPIVSHNIIYDKKQQQTNNQTHNKHPAAMGNHYFTQLM